MVHFAIFGPLDEAGFPPQWTNETVISIVGQVKLDLTRRVPAPNARLTVVSIVGRTAIRVPAGRRLSVGGGSAFGVRHLAAEPGNGPDLYLDLYAIVGQVDVTEEPLPERGTG